MLAASAYDYVLALHIIAVVVAFGWTFTLPVVYIVAARVDPRGLPLLHRIEYTIFKLILNPARSWFSARASSSPATDTTGRSSSCSGDSPSSWCWAAWSGRS